MYDFVVIFFQAVALNCGHCCCDRCAGHWTAKDSACPTCKTELSKKPVYLYAIDDVVKEMSKFQKECKYFFNSKEEILDGKFNPQNLAKVTKTMNYILLHRLKNIESQLMCDFCHYKLNTVRIERKNI